MIMPTRVSAQYAHVLSTMDNTLSSMMKEEAGYGRDLARTLSNIAHHVILAFKRSRVSCRAASKVDLESSALNILNYASPKHHHPRLGSHRVSPG
jgi:hypothetical protein